MDNAKKLNSLFSNLGDNLLLVWWGIVMIVHPLTIGMGAIGSGLILLGVNAARLLKRLPTKRATTVVGVMAILWGALDTVLHPRLEFSFALLLIVIGSVSLAALLARSIGRDFAQKEQ
jgi:hypothetical protein